MGSKFYFDIPYVKGEHIPKIDYTKGKSQLQNLSGYNILIADDEESNFALTKRLLKKTKANIDWAITGTQAVDKAMSKNFQLILMDIKMPDMDGIEATRRIKAMKPECVIVMQTAYAMDEVKERAKKAGCDGFIVKPIELELFMRMVNKVFSS